MENPHKASWEKIHYLSGRNSFTVMFSNFVNVLKEYRQFGYLQSNSTLYTAVDNSPQYFKEFWWFFVDYKNLLRITRTGGTLKLMPPKSTSSPVEEISAGTKKLQSARRLKSDGYDIGML